MHGLRRDRTGVQLKDKYRNLVCPCPGCRAGSLPCVRAFHLAGA